MQLKHIHNALEFADLREGAPYEVEYEGNVVNPLAHVAVHAAVKGQIEKEPEVKPPLRRWWPQALRLIMLSTYLVVFSED